MANSLIDFNAPAQMAMQMMQLGEQQRRNDLTASGQQQEARRIELEENRLKQTSAFRAFDEMEKLAKSPQFANPMAQIDLRYSQANLLKHGLGVDVPVPSREEMVGAHEQFAEMVRTFRNSEDPAERRAAVEKMIISAPDYGKNILDEMKKAGELDEQGEMLAQKVALNEGKIRALNLKSGRINMQQSLYTEHMGAVSHSLQVAESPEFKQHYNRIMTIKDPTARAVYLTRNPEFKKAFESALAPQKEQMGMVGPEFVEDFGEDVKPRLLSALDQEVQSRLAAKNEAIEKNGIAPQELGEELAGFSLVREARSIQAEWLQDPYNPEKFAAMKKAHQNMRIAYDANGKASLGVQDERLQIMQNKFDAGQQAKQAEDFSQQKMREYLEQGYTENKAALLAGKDTMEKYPGVPFSAKDLRVHKPLVENVTKVSMTEEKEEAKKVGGGFGEQYITLQKADLDSRAKVSKYDRMDQLLSQIETGKLEPAKTSIQAIAESLGLDVDKSLPSKQAFQALSGEIALSLRNPSGGAGMPGALSDKDLAFLQSMTPDLGKTTEGNRLIIETARKLAKRDQDVAKMAREYRKKHGQFDEGFFDELAVYSDKNQLFAERPTGGKKGAAPSGKAAQPQADSIPTIKGESDYNKIPSGSIYIGPDGKRRRKS